MTCFIVSLNLSAHESKIALFELSQQDDQVVLSIRLDLEDLATSIGTPLSSVPPECSAIAETYIYERVKININEKMLDICMLNQSQDGHYLKITASLGEVKGNIEKINIWNTCFIDSIAKHSNIIHARLNKKTRSFRMDKDRTFISISYE